MVLQYKDQPRIIIWTDFVKPITLMRHTKTKVIGTLVSGMKIFKSCYLNIENLHYKKTADSLPNELRDLAIFNWLTFIHLLSAAKTLQNDTAVTNMAQSQSSLMASHLDVAKNRNQASVWRFWWLSNSSMNLFCTLNARIVWRPCKEALRWENTGLLAEIDTTKFHLISYDMASRSEITPCPKIDKPLVVYRFSGNIMTSITTLCT